MWKWSDCRNRGQAGKGSKRWTRGSFVAINPRAEDATVALKAMASSDEEIYQEHILDHYEDPYHRGHLDHATHHHQDDNPLCGDVVRVDLKIDDEGKVVEAFFDGEGCCISQASASMLIEKVEGQSIDFVKEFTAEDMLALFGAQLTPNRQKCCLLSWRVLQSAIYAPCGDDTGQAESSQQSESP